MFKLPGTPSPRASAYELTDYAEWVCWRDATSSMTQLLKDLGRLAENDYSRRSTRGGTDRSESSKKRSRKSNDERQRVEVAIRLLIGDEGYTLRTSAESLRAPSKLSTSTYCWQPGWT